MGSEVMGVVRSEVMRVVCGVRGDEDFQVRGDEGCVWG